MDFCRGVNFGLFFSLYMSSGTYVLDDWMVGQGKEGTGMVWDGIMLEREILGSSGCSLLP